MQCSMEDLSCSSCSCFSSSSSSSSSSFTSSSSSCFCSTRSWRYDVFLSFRGLDTRNNFSDHLYSGLVERNIRVFRDDKKLGKGKVITETIYKAINRSRFSIVVFSRNYACSEWCLDELVEIVGCMNEKGHTAFPIFYQINPDDVMNQTGPFEEPFIRHHQVSNKDRVQSWRIALARMAGIAGWDAQICRSEPKLIKKVVERISHNLKCTSPCTSKQPVSISSSIKEMNLYLYEGLDKMEIVRICGMNEIANTTIARVFYDAVVNQKWGQRRFQEILSEMPKECDRNIWDAATVINMIRKKLQHRKVLVLIDDLDHLEQVVSLVKRHRWFTPGSRIIVSATTPSKMILNVLEISFHKPVDKKNAHRNLDEQEDGQNSIVLDIACFFKKMDDDDVTRVIRLLVGGDQQENNGMKVLISKTLINASDSDNLLMYDFLEDISQQNLEETRSDIKCLNSRSGKSIRKAKSKPRLALIGNQRQCPARTSVKVRVKEACDVSLVSTSRAISESRHAIDEEFNAAKSHSLHSFLEESMTAVTHNANGVVESKPLFTSGESFQQTMRLKITNGEKTIFSLESQENIFDDLMNKRTKSVSCNNVEIHEWGRGLPPSKQENNQKLKEASLMDSQLQSFMPENINGKKIVRIPMAVVEDGIKQWELCLVGQLLGNCSEITPILNMANRLWGKEGRIDVKKTENDLYIFKFPNERTRDSVLESGPWYISNNPMVMRRWQPKMQLLEIDKSKIPVWVKLRGIPVECITVDGLSYISSFFGKPLHMDTETASSLWKPLYMDRENASMCRLAFVRVCVEVSIEDEIIETIPVMVGDSEVVVVKVEYCWIPDKCVICKEFGHSTNKCPRAKKIIGKAD